jgi:exopolysaccharide production protein ExoQ
MPASVATAVYISVILVLFWLDRDQEVRPSKALWIPVLWLLIAGSRSVSLWFQPQMTIDSAAQFAEANPLNDVVLSLLLGAGLLVLVRRGQRVTRLLRTNGPVILFFLYCGLSVLWSEFPGVAFRHWLRSLGDPVMVLVVLTEADLGAALATLIKRMAFVLIPLSVLLIKYFPELGREYNYWTFLPSYCGVAWNKNSLGLLCLTSGLGSLWCFLSVYRDQRGRERLRRMLAHAAILLMIFWMFWMADSVTSSCCFLLTAGLMVITSLFPSARKPGVLSFLMAAVVCVPLFALFSGMGGGLVEDLGRNPTLTGRTVIWKVVLSVSGNPLLGTGFESFWLPDRLQTIWQWTMSGLQEAHNGYLEVYLNLGWVGVALLATLIVKGYRNVMAWLRRDPALGTLMLAFFVAPVIYSLTEAGFRMMNLSWITFLLVAVATPQAVFQESAVEDEQRLELADPEIQLSDEDAVFPREEPSFMRSN